MLGRFCRTIHALPTRSKPSLVLCSVFVPAALIGVAGSLGIRLNLTNSVPIGLYIISNSPKADLVEFCRLSHSGHCRASAAIVSVPVSVAQMERSLC